MSSAKRRINSTGRKRISRDCIDIRMLEGAPGEPLKAKAVLDLKGQGFPGSAVVAIEAYHRSSGMRFQCGTVDALTIPPVLVLDEVDRSGSVLFRIKVADSEGQKGRILGSAERIQPRSEDDGEGRRSLFPIIYRDIGTEVWKVELEYGDRPKLVLNTRMPGFSHRLQESAMIQGLMLPAAFRIVLEKLLADSETGDDDEDDGGWKAEWFEYCASELGMTGEAQKMDEEEKREWSEEAVRKFCEKGGFIKRIRKLEGAEQ